MGLKETEIEIDSATVRSRIHSVILNVKIDYLATFRDSEGNGRRHHSSVLCGQEKELHNLHHVGVDRMLYLIRKANPDVTRDFKR